jgi:hypothetical protein
MPEAEQQVSSLCLEARVQVIPTALKIDLRPVSGGDRGDALFVVGEEHPSFA